MLMQLCRDHKSVPEHLSVLKQRSLPVGQDDFMAVAKDYNEIFVLVDALDECNRENRPNILGFLNDILHSHSKAHVCVMSRPENDITRALERDDTFVIRLQEHDLKPDIETYVKDEVTALREGRNGVQLFLKREELVSEIIQTLSEQAAGMFLWARLQLQDLCRVSESRKDDEVCKALAQLPPGLDATYLRILEQIDRKSDYIRVSAIETLQIVIYARRPLRTKELQFALVHFGHDQNDKNFELDDCSVILEACSNLLVLDVNDLVSRAGTIVRPTHFSVQQFLENRNDSADMMHPILRSFRTHEANATLAEICMLHLFRLLMHLEGFRPASCPGYWLSQDIFLLYASNAFDKHILLAGEKLRDSLRDYITRLLRSEHDLFSVVLTIRSFLDWQQDLCSNYDSNLESVKTVIERYDRYGRGLIAGVSATAFVDSTLLSQRRDITSQCDASQVSPQALLYACLSCSESEIPIRRLLEKGFDVNANDYQGRTALGIAFERRSESLVRLLLAKKANVNARDEEGNTILQKAIYLGKSYAIIRSLIEQGAEINALGGKLGNCLQVASIGSLEICELLIEKGANVNADHDGKYGTALVAACANRQLDTARFLLEKGANPHDHQKGNENGNALHATLNYPLSDSLMEMLRLLIGHGIDINARSGSHGFALQTAARREHVEAVELLIKIGADVHAVGGQSGSALQAACRKGSVEIVQILLEHGANADLWVPCERHIEPFDLVWGYCSSASDQDEYPKSFDALGAALDSNELVDVVALLLQHKAAVTSLTFDHAVRRGRWKSLAVILDRNRHLHLTGVELRSALEAAEESLTSGTPVTWFRYQEGGADAFNWYRRQIPPVIELLKQRLGEIAS